MKIKEVQIYCDHDTPERAGAAGTFQVSSIIAVLVNGEKVNLTNKVDVGRFYYSRQELLDELNLGITNELIEWF